MSMIKFKKLSSQERKQYVANTISQSTEEEVAKIRLTRNLTMDDLNLESRTGCFEWISTPQGHTYWKDIEARITGVWSPF